MISVKFQPIEEKVFDYRRRKRAILVAEVTTLFAMAFFIGGVCLKVFDIIAPVSAYHAYAFFAVLIALLGVAVIGFANRAHALFPSFRRAIEEIDRNLEYNFKLLTFFDFMEVAHADTLQRRFLDNYYETVKGEDFTRNLSRERLTRYRKALLITAGGALLVFALFLHPALPSNTKTFLRYYYALPFVSPAIAYDVRYPKTILRYHDLPITLRGEMENAVIEYETEGRGAHRVTLISDGASYTHTVRRVGDDFTFDLYLYQGGKEKRVYENKVRVVDAPYITSLSVRAEAPSYTKASPTLRTNEGYVEGVSNTRVTIKATANNPLSAASFTFIDAETKSVHTFDIPERDVKGTRVTYAFPLHVDGEYFFTLYDEQGFTNELVPHYPIRVHSDKRPELVVSDPGTTNIPVLPSLAGALPVRYAAVDDYGLTEVGFYAETFDENGDAVPDAKMEHRFVNKGEKTRVQGAYDFHFEGLVPEESVVSAYTVSFWLYAKDTLGQETRSPIMRLVAPTKKETFERIDETVKTATNDLAEAEKSVSNYVERTEDLVRDLENDRKLGKTDAPSEEDEAKRENIKQETRETREQLDAIRKSIQEAQNEMEEAGLLDEEVLAEYRELEKKLADLTETFKGIEEDLSGLSPSSAAEQEAKVKSASEKAKEAERMLANMKRRIERLEDLKRLSYITKEMRAIADGQKGVNDDYFRTSAFTTNMQRREKVVASRLRDLDDQLRTNAIGLTPALYHNLPEMPFASMRSNVATMTEGTNRSYDAAKNAFNEMDKTASALEKMMKRMLSKEKDTVVAGINEALFHLHVIGNRFYEMRDTLTSYQKAVAMNAMLLDENLLKVTTMAQEMTHYKNVLADLFTRFNESVAAKVLLQPERHDALFTVLQSFEELDAAVSAFNHGIDNKNPRIFDTLIARNNTMVQVNNRAIMALLYLRNFTRDQQRNSQSQSLSRIAKRQQSLNRRTQSASSCPRGQQQGSGKKQGGTSSGSSGQGEGREGVSKKGTAPGQGEEGDALSSYLSQLAKEQKELREMLASMRENEGSSGGAKGAGEGSGERGGRDKDGRDAEGTGSEKGEGEGSKGEGEKGGAEGEGAPRPGEGTREAAAKFGEKSKKGLGDVKAIEEEMRRIEEELARLAEDGFDERAYEALLERQRNVLKQLLSHDLGIKEEKTRKKDDERKAKAYDGPILKEQEGVDTTGLDDVEETRVIDDVLLDKECPPEYRKEAEEYLDYLRKTRER